MRYKVPTITGKHAILSTNNYRLTCDIKYQQLQVNMRYKVPTITG